MTHITDEELTAFAHARYYHWWTVSVSRQHVKLGPLAVGWYRWFNGCLYLDCCWLNQRPFWTTNPAMRLPTSPLHKEN